MDKELQDLARTALKSGLAVLPEPYVVRFKQTYYSHDREADINTVVDSMPEDRLDLAMTQVRRSINKLRNKGILPH